MASSTISRLRLVFLMTLGALPLVWASTAHAQERAAPPDFVIEQFGAPPDVPVGPLTGDLAYAVEVLADSMVHNSWRREEIFALTKVSQSGDPRLAWILSDLMRFIRRPGVHRLLGEAAAELLGAEAPTQNHWGFVTDRLIAWDIPAPPDY
ncbi:MAG: hypothetical protein AAGM38_18750, partial [Pseudomonadota bacterium]